jgi:flagellar biosynthetic protein FliS
VGSSDITALSRRKGLASYGVFHRQAGLDVRQGSVDEKQFLVEMLFDGLASALCTARFALRESPGNKNPFREAVARCKRIILGLQLALDSSKSVELAQWLGGLYRYWLQRLSMIHRSLDPADEIDQLIEMVGEIRKAWQDAR